MRRNMLGKFGKSKITKSPSDKCLSDLHISFHTDVIENDVIDNLSNEIGNRISKSFQDQSLDDNDFVRTSLFLIVNTVFQLYKYTITKITENTENTENTESDIRSMFNVETSSTSVSRVSPVT